MNLEMCNECLNYKIVNEYGRCSECEKDIISGNENQLKQDLDDYY